MLVGKPNIDLNAYKVVAFMVKVKLVEKSVKRKVGIVMVVKVISQYSIPGMTLIKNIVIRPKVQSHDWCVVDCSMAVSLAKARTEGNAVFMVLGKLEKLSTTDETVSERDIMNCWAGPALAELTAVRTIQSLICRDTIPRVAFESWSSKDEGKSSSREKSCFDHKLYWASMHTWPWKWSRQGEEGLGLVTSHSG